MTRQPAIDVGIFLFMTFNTLPHAPVLVRQAVKVLNLSVAFLARNFAVDMPLVIKQDMLGHIVDFLPGSGCLGVEILMLLLDPGMFLDNIIMAVQTFFHRRNARVIGIGNVGVTVLALNLLDAAVNRVAEGNRLFRPETAIGPRPKHKNKACARQSGDQGQQNKDGIFSQRIIPCQKAA
jgi:hypothetical protein